MNVITDMKCECAIAAAGYLGPATVLEVNAAEGLVLVEWPREGERCRSWARPALAGATKLEAGDVALLISQNLQDFYAIGVLSGRKGEDPPSLRSCGEAGEDENQKNSRELTFEHHPSAGKTRVVFEKGDLEFVTKEGSISFQSAREIRFGAATLRLTAQRMETMTETLVTKTRNLFHKVEELTQIQTGRLRTLVKAAFLMKARNVSMRADEHFKVDGEKIHLG